MTKIYTKKPPQKPPHPMIFDNFAKPPHPPPPQPRPNEKPPHPTPEKSGQSSKPPHPRGGVVGVIYNPDARSHWSPFQNRNRLTPRQERS